MSSAAAVKVAVLGIGLLGGKAVLRLEREGHSFTVVARLWSVLSSLLFLS
jgi:3-hydroxyisobutyrate dehydrogenase-like beta-hydroxyacid dehydrogenase